MGWRFNIFPRFNTRVAYNLNAHTWTRKSHIKDNNRSVRRFHWEQRFTLPLLMAIERFPLLFSPNFFLSSSVEQKSILNMSDLQSIATVHFFGEGRAVFYWKCYASQFVCSSSRASSREGRNSSDGMKPKVLQLKPLLQLGWKRSFYAVQETKRS